MEQDAVIGLIVLVAVYSATVYLVLKSRKIIRFINSKKDRTLRSITKELQSEKQQ